MPDGRMTNELQRFGEERQVLADGAVELDVRLTRCGPDDQFLAHDPYVLKLLDARDPHEVRGLRETEVHQRDEALPTRENPSFVA
jgi:hypothetical protein